MINSYNRCIPDPHNDDTLKRRRDRDDGDERDEDHDLIDGMKTFHLERLFDEMKEEIERNDDGDDSEGRNHSRRRQRLSFQLVRSYGFR